MRYALGVVALLSLGLVGCEKLDTYSINSPADLQHRIDSIAAAKPNTGDTTYLIVSTPIVGAENNSAGWWTAFTDYFKIPSNKLLHLEFINYSSGAGNYNNWNLAVTNDTANRSASTYKEYFVLRSDAYGWGGKMKDVDASYAFDAKLIANDYKDIDGDGDIWNDFRTTMQGARVSMDIDHSATGNVFVTAKAVGTNGVTIVETYNQPVSASEGIIAFLVADGSHFNIKKAYLLPSKVTTITDVNPVSIAVTGAPEFVELGSTNFWGNAKATVTFADGSSKLVDTADVSFNIVPDMTTVGKKTVVLAYSKTKKGAYGKAVSTFYNLEVTNAVKSLKITTMPDVTTYTFPGPVAPIFNTTGLVVTATYSDGSTGVIGNDKLQFSNPGGDGSQNAVITYVGLTASVTTTCPITNVLKTQQVGADITTPWWSVFSDEYKVAPGLTKVFTMHCYSNGANNWNAPVTILRKTKKSDEYAVVRIDNFGWGGSGYSTATLSNDWDINTLKTNINDSEIKITVSNLGNGKANVRYDVTFANGEKHFQLYEGITVDSADLNCAITVDGCYIQIKSVQ